MLKKKLHCLFMPALVFCASDTYSSLLFINLMYFFSGLSVADASVDPSHTVHGSNLSPPTVLQFGKSRKLSVERSDPRK